MKVNGFNLASIQGTTGIQGIRGIQGSSVQGIRGPQGVQGITNSTQGSTGISGIGIKGLNNLFNVATASSIWVISNISAQPNSSTALVANRLYATPFLPAKNTPYTGLFVYVASGTAVSGRILIYSDLNGKPNTKLYESTDLSLTPVGNKIVTTSGTFIAGTVYWLCFYTNGTPPISCYNPNGIMALQVDITQSTAPVITSCYVTATYGSAPSTFGTPTFSNALTPMVAIITG